MVTLDFILEVICETLSLDKDVMTLPHPYGSYKDGREILTALCHQQNIEKSTVAEKMKLKNSTSVDEVFHRFKVKINHNPQSLLNDRYKMCKKALEENMEVLEKEIEGAL